MLPSNNWFYFFILLAFTACQEEEVRVYPVVYVNNNFYENSKLRTKVLLNAEQKEFKTYMQKNKMQFTPNGSGVWMSNQPKITNYTAKTNDYIKYQYQILNLDNQVLYNFDELGTKEIILGKANVIRGLQSSLQYIEPNDSATVLIPSNLAFGYKGDGNKINPNQAIVLNIRVLEVRKTN